MNYSIVGGKKLSGSVQTNISKNASVALLAASLLNKGVTTLKRVPRIEEVRRLIEVMRSIGVTIEWNETTGDMVITPPERFDLEHIDRTAAGKTRSIFMFIAPLAHRLGSCLVPAPTGCNLGKRSLGSHIDALARLGIHISGDAATQSYKVEVGEMRAADIVMYEASDTGVENVLMAAALVPGETTIKFASANYMVQDLCVFLQSLGVRIDGIGTSTLVIHGVADIDMPVTGYPSEDPIETMFFISAAATTGSELTITRCPIDFVELELFTLGHMGLSYEIGKRYVAENGHTMPPRRFMKVS
jgi:UDP-N-acetylglucosamine 1-carboxyvinyltransferase